MCLEQLPVSQKAMLPSSDAPASNSVNINKQYALRRCVLIIFSGLTWFYCLNSCFNC